MESLSRTAAARACSSSGPLLTEGPRELRDPARLAARRTRLGEPHIAPLVAYAAGLRREGRGDVPDPDPADGGVHAQVLFLLEKPGPSTCMPGGSRLVSRDNDNATAAAIHGMMREAGMARHVSLLWNIVPWWNGTTALRAPELAEGAARLTLLLALLPELRVAVLAGRNAGRAAGPVLAAAGLPVLTSAHPSPQVRAAFPARWAAIPAQWAQARHYLAPASSLH